MFPYPVSFLGNADEAFSTKFLEFDGVDDYIETPAVFSLLDGLSNFAFSFWFKPSTFVDKQSLFWIDGTSATTDYAQTQLILRPNYLIWYFNNIGYYVYSNIGNPLVADTWYHVLCTRDDSRATGDKARIYIDGVNESQYDSSRHLGTLDTSTSGLKIGDGDYRLPFSGNIDEFAVYNQDMAAYVSEIYNSGTPDDLNNLATAPAPNLWYRMGENATFKSPQILMPENTNKDKVSNYSMAFDGINDYVDLGDFSTYDNGDLSCSFWMYKTGSINAHIISNSGSSSRAGFDIKINSSERLYLRCNTRTTTLQSGWKNTTITDNAWFHIAITFDEAANEGKIYVNGVLISTIVGYSRTNSASTDLAIGSNSGGTSAFFTGKIDEVSIFNSVKAIGDLWDGTGQPTDLTGESGLVGYWKMGEDATYDAVASEWTIPDQAGSNDGTSANMTIEDRVGDAPGSENNSLSYNMDAADIVEETP